MNPLLTRNGASVYMCMWYVYVCVCAYVHFHNAVYMCFIEGGITMQKSKSVMHLGGWVSAGV